VADYVRSVAKEKRKGAKEPIEFVSTGQWPRATLATPAGADETLLVPAKIMQEFARRLGAEMERQHLNTYSLEKKSGVPEATIRRLLAGRSFGNTVNMLRLEEAIGKPLLGEFRDPPGTRRPARS